MTQDEKNKIRKIIEDIYRVAEVTQPNLPGEVTETTVSILYEMLSALRDKSKAFSWVPKPPAAGLSPFWFISNFTSSAISTSLEKTSRTVAVTVVWQFKSRLAISFE